MPPTCRVFRGRLRRPTNTGVVATLEAFWSVFQAKFSKPPVQKPTGIEFYWIVLFLRYHGKPLSSSRLSSSYSRTILFGLEASHKCSYSLVKNTRPFFSRATVNSFFTPPDPPITGGLELRIPSNSIPFKDRFLPDHTASDFGSPSTMQFSRRNCRSVERCQF